MLVALVVLSVMVTASLWGYERRTRARALAGRDELSLADLRAQMGCRRPEDAAAISAAWHDVSDILGVSAGMLRPEDSLSDLRVLPRCMEEALVTDVDLLIGLVRDVDAHACPACLGDAVLVLAAAYTAANP